MKDVSSSTSCTRNDGRERSQRYLKNEGEEEDGHGNPSRPENYKTNSSKCFRIRPLSKNRLSHPSRTEVDASWCGRRSIPIAYIASQIFDCVPETIDDDYQPQSRFPSQRHDVQRPLSQSERDWMYAERALARGNDPEEVIRRIAHFRSSETSDPLYYARLTVKKAQANMGRESVEATRMRESEQIDVGRSSFDKSSATRR